MICVYVIFIGIACCVASHRLQNPEFSENFFRHLSRNHLVYAPNITPADTGTTPNVITLSEEDNKLAAEKGVQVPSDDCVITWDQFNEHIKDKDWIGLYRVQDQPFIRDIFKYSGLWTVLNETFIQRRTSFWNPAVNRCVYGDNVFKRAHDSRAIFQSQGGNLVAFPYRSEYFVSSNPDKYLLFFICFDTTKIADGRCPTSGLLLAIRDQRENDLNDKGVRGGPVRINDVPWSEIEANLQRCHGLSFIDDTHPQLVWIWQNEECPKPWTPAAEEGK